MIAGAALLASGAPVVLAQDSGALQEPFYQQIGHRHAPTYVAAYAGWAAWSEYSSTSKRYRLVLRRAGEGLVRPTVPSRSVPFDVDMGRGPGKKPTVVYSRCKREAAADQYLAGGPSLGRGCRIVALTAGSSHEQRLTGSLGAIGRPAIWDSRVAYVLSSGGRERVVSVTVHKTRTRRTLFSSPQGGDVVRLDLQGRRVLYNVDVPRQGHELRTQVIGAHSRVLDRQLNTDSTLSTVVGASMSGAQAAWTPISQSALLTLFDFSTGTKRPVVTASGIDDMALDGDSLVLDLGPYGRKDIHTDSCYPPRGTGDGSCVAREQIAPG